MPDGVEWTRPSGGYTAWLTLQNSNMTEDELLECLMSAGVKVGPGGRYFANQPDSVHFRLSIACVGEEEIESGCALLGRVLGDAMGA
jgi:2-aminoadipate transaminase